MIRKIMLGVFVWAVLTLTYSAFASKEFETQERSINTALIFNNLTRLNLHIMPMTVGIDEQEELNWCADNVEANTKNSKEFVNLLKTDIRNGRIQEMDMTDAEDMGRAFHELYDLCVLADSHDEFLSRFEFYATQVEALVDFRNRLMDEMNTSL